MNSITVSAPGKLMLLGEHAVVYGYPSIVTAINQRLSVAIQPGDKPGVEVVTPDSRDNRFINACLQATSYKLQAIKISTRSSFSGKYGFGSSAAVTVATLKALSEFYHKPLAEKELFDLAYKVVLEVQKTGSGFDVAASVYGGTIYFGNKGEVVEKISSLSQGYSLVVGYSGVKANTVSLINQVSQLREKDSITFKKIMTGIVEIVDCGKEALLKKDFKQFGKLMNNNQVLLKKLGVSTKKLDAMIMAALNAGALGAKISGAGGGDCMIALAPEGKRNAIERAITSVKGEIVPIEMNAIGVTVEK